nr:hypothetical protein [Rhodovulum imhoffii]
MLSGLCWPEALTGDLPGWFTPSSRTTPVRPRRH